MRSVLGDVSGDYSTLLKDLKMVTLEQRRRVQSMLATVYKCFTSIVSQYISKLVQERHGS